MSWWLVNLSLCLQLHHYSYHIPTAQPPTVRNLSGTPCHRPQGAAPQMCWSYVPCIGFSIPKYLVRTPKLFHLSYHVIPIFDGIVSDQAVVVVVVLFVVAIIVVRCFRQVFEVICSQVPGAWKVWMMIPSLKWNFCLWMYWRNVSVTSLWLQYFWWAFTMGNLNGWGIEVSRQGPPWILLGPGLVNPKGPAKSEALKHLQKLALTGSQTRLPTSWGRTFKSTRSHSWDFLVVACLNHWRTTSFKMICLKVGVFPPKRRSVCQSIGCLMQEWTHMWKEALTIVT